jgi:hypothetical protein
MLPGRVAVFERSGVIPCATHTEEFHPLIPMCCIVTLELSDSANARFVDHMAENGWIRGADGAWRNERYFAGRRFSDSEARSTELKRFFGPDVTVGLLN